MIKMTQLMYNPTLETVLMIEETIKKNSGEYRVTQIWNKLPRRVMYQTYKIVIEYLIESNKITIEKDGKITWIWNPRLIKKILKEGVKIR